MFENKVTEGTELSDSELQEIEKKFDHQWEQGMKEIEENYTLPTEHDIKNQIIRCLSSKCGLTMHNHILVEEKEKSISCRGQAPITVKIEPGRHTIIGKWQQFKNMFLSTDDREKVQKATDAFLAAAQSYFVTHKDEPYGDHHIVSIVRNMLQSIDAFDQKKEIAFTFTTKY